MASTALLSSSDAAHDEQIKPGMDGKTNRLDEEAVRVDGKKTLRIQGAELVVNGGYLQGRRGPGNRY
jgi:hypothetical protein